MTARIIRPDLRCTNGYVHVIDTVLMRSVLDFMSEEESQCMPAITLQGQGRLHFSGRDLGAANILECG